LKIIAIIPARYNSKRFPGKPLALILGTPMIQHVYQRSKECSDLDEVYVATDDIRIYNCVTEFGGKAIITAADHPSGTDRVFEATEKVQIDDRDIVVNIQGDQPFFHPSMISDLIKPLKDDHEIPMATLIYKIKKDTDIQDGNKVKAVFDNNKYALYFSRLPIPFCRDENKENAYYKHIGVYAYRKKFLHIFTGLSPGALEKTEKLEQLRVLEHGFKIKLIETICDSIEVDTPEDIKAVEEKLSEGNKNFT
jgi:3-deoxy-manno-octulosonate cytidylyltransferase (CMP-KDO synthetase)